MDRHNRNQHDYDYDRYEGYDRNDEHYHSTRNLTDQFERNYQHDRGHWNDDRDHNRIPHSYHEGNMGDMYEHRRKEVSGYGDYMNNNRNDWNRNRDYSDDFNRNQDRYNSHEGSFRDNQNRFNNDRFNDLDYGSNSSNRFNDVDYSSNRDKNTFYSNNANRRNSYRGLGDEQDYYPGSGGDDRRSRYGSGPNNRTQDNWYSSGHRRDEENRYY